MSNDWALKMLNELGPEFYGELIMEVRAGEIRKVERREKFISPQERRAVEQRKLLTTAYGKVQIKRD